MYVPAAQGPDEDGKPTALAALPRLRYTERTIVGADAAWPTSFPLLVSLSGSRFER